MEKGVSIIYLGRNKEIDDYKIESPSDNRFKEIVGSTVQVVQQRLSVSEDALKVGITMSMAEGWRQ